MTAARPSAERGSVLILMPAMVLVLLVLGAIAVDSAIAYLGQRQLQDFAASAADQVAAQAFDQNAFYGNGVPGGRVAIDADRAGVVVQQLEAGYSTGGLTITSARALAIDGGRGVLVTAVGTVHDVFGPAVGGRATVTVRASASATLDEVGIRP